MLCEVPLLVLLEVPEPKLSELPLDSEFDIFVPVLVPKELDVPCDSEVEDPQLTLEPLLTLVDCDVF